MLKATKPDFPKEGSLLWSTKDQTKPYHLGMKMAYSRATDM